METIYRLADIIGVTLSERVAEPSKFDENYDEIERGSFFYNGSTIATSYRRNGMTTCFSAHELLHELLHFFVATKEQRDLPDYGLGAGDFAYAPNVVDLESENYKESQRQEWIVQLLCCWIGPKLGISVFQTQYPTYTYSWDEYLRVKLEEMGDRAWRAISEYWEYRKKLEALL